MSLHIETVSYHFGGNVVDLGSWRFGDRFPPGTHKFSIGDFYIKILQIRSFDNKKYRLSSASGGRFHFVTENRTHNLCINGELGVPQRYQCVMLSFIREVSLFIERTDYRSNLAKTILFENCSCFSKIPFSISVESPRIFQGLISIPAGHWVRQIDGKSSAIYLADSFCQHYSALWSAWQEDPTDPQERCAMARTCARGYRKLILRANLLDVPNINMAHIQQPRAPAHIQQPRARCLRAVVQTACETLALSHSAPARVRPRHRGSTTGHQVSLASWTHRTSPGSSGRARPAPSQQGPGYCEEW